MPRPMSSGMIDALSTGIIYPVIFVQMAFITETVYIWSGLGATDWNGHTWQGLGSLLGFSTPEDSSTVEAKGITITLSGIDATLMPEALTDFQLGLPVTVYFGALNAGSLFGTPVVAWAGRMDQPSFEISGNEVTLSINCENRLIDMNIAVDRRYTNEDQQLDFPGDLGCQFVDGLQEKTLFWGGYPASQNNI